MVNMLGTRPHQIDVAVNDETSTKIVTTTQTYKVIELDRFDKAELFNRPLIAIVNDELGTYEVINTAHIVSVK